MLHKVKLGRSESRSFVLIIAESAEVSDEKKSLLIDAVHSFPALWNQNAAEYKQRDLKVKNWASVAASTDLSGESISLTHTHTHLDWNVH